MKIPKAMENKLVYIYKHQLKFGCKKQGCPKIFCKALCKDTLIETVSNILALYGDEFTCERLNKIQIGEYKEKGFWCTDLMFYYLEVVREEDLSLGLTKSLGEATPYITDLDCEDPTGPVCLEGKLKQINIKRDFQGDFQRDCKRSHKFCKFLNKQALSQEESFVLVGVVGVLLKRYEKSQNYSLGILIIRIINVLDCQNSFSAQQLLTIYKIFFNVHLVSSNLRNKRNMGPLSENACIEGEVFCTDTKQGERSPFDTEGESILVEGRNTNVFNGRHTSMLLEPLGQLNNSSTIVPPHNVTINTDFDLQVAAQDVAHEASEVLSPVEENTGLENSTLENKMELVEPENGECANLKNNLHYTCLDAPAFNRNDLLQSVIVISALLNSIDIVDIRENKKVETLLNIFHLLYLINEKELVVNYKRFYLPQFCAKINFKEEFKFYRAKSKTPLNFTFILPVHIKAELIKAETNDLMKASLQDSFFRALFEGHIGPYLVIVVSRENIYNESLDIIKSLSIEEVRKQLRITFRNEEGVDSGGIRKEYFQLLSHEIKHDERLFKTSENIIWLRNDCVDMSSYMAIGRILGIALYNNVVLNIPFPSIFFKKLLNKKTTFNDLKEIEPELFASLSNLKKLSDEDLVSLNLTFTINYVSSKGKIKTFNLNEDKTEKVVNKSNVNSFVNRYADFYINRVIHRQFEAIRCGFYFVLEKDTLMYLDHKELEKIIMGSNEFDVHSLRSTATYSGYSIDSKIINWFWEVFEGYGRKMRKKLLQFITGNDRIPVAGAASLKLVIMKNGCDTDRLPSSQTCFNTLLLPEYSTKEKFESKLNTALEMTAGFYLL